MFPSLFVSSAVSDKRKIDRSTPTSLPLAHYAALKLILRLPGLDDTIHAIINSYLKGTLADDIHAISIALTVKASILDVSVHHEPLEHSGSLLTTSVTPPVLSSPTSPTKSTIAAQLESGSEIIYFDDGGALICHMAEPNPPSKIPEKRPYLGRPLATIPVTSLIRHAGSFVDATSSTPQISFNPMTPIIECLEPSDLLETPFLASRKGSSGTRASLSVIDLPSKQGASQFDFTTPSASYIEDNSYSTQNATDSDSDADFVLPNSYRETTFDDTGLKTRISNGNFIDGENFRCLFCSSASDIDDFEVTPRFGVLGLQCRHSQGSGGSSPGPLTHSEIYPNDTDSDIASGSGSHFDAHDSTHGLYQPKARVTLTLLQYRQPPRPIELPAGSVFDPFGID
jgi:hypothetical protein